MNAPQEIGILDGFAIYVMHNTLNHDSVSVRDWDGETVFRCRTVNTAIDWIKAIAAGEAWAVEAKVQPATGVHPSHAYLRGQRAVAGEANPYTEPLLATEWNRGARRTA